MLIITGVHSCTNYRIVYFVLYFLSNVVPRQLAEQQEGPEFHSIQEGVVIFHPTVVLMRSSLLYSGQSSLLQNGYILCFL
jgi:hypothetical protein